jgi:hypothetical protein
VTYPSTPSPNRLVKGLYGHEFKSASRLFGLLCGQMRFPDFVHNGGWYNGLGEKLGWGDLSLDDFVRLAKELEPGEEFYILGESASFWNFVTQHGAIGSLCAVKPDAQAPGIEYVKAKARFLITAGHVTAFIRYEGDDGSWLQQQLPGVVVDVQLVER